MYASKCVITVIVVSSVLTAYKLVINIQYRTLLQMANITCNTKKVTKKNEWEKFPNSRKSDELNEQSGTENARAKWKFCQVFTTWVFDSVELFFCSFCASSIQTHTNAESRFNSHFSVRFKVLWRCYHFFLQWKCTYIRVNLSVLLIFCRCCSV